LIFHLIDALWDNLSTEPPIEHGDYRGTHSCSSLTARASSVRSSAKFAFGCAPFAHAKRLPMVSRHWLRELKKPMNRIVWEAGPMNLHLAILEGAYNKVWTLRHDGGSGW
jgi:hypothetical protein